MNEWKKHSSTYECAFEMEWAEIIVYKHRQMEIQFFLKCWSRCQHTEVIIDLNSILYSSKQTSALRPKKCDQIECTHTHTHTIIMNLEKIWKKKKRVQNFWNQKQANIISLFSAWVRVCAAYYEIINCSTKKQKRQTNERKNAPNWNAPLTRSNCFIIRISLRSSRQTLQLLIFLCVLESTRGATYGAYYKLFEYIFVRIGMQRANNN